MVFKGEIVNIFVSSPGDVSEYRQSILSVVQAWNQRNGRAKRIFFNCLRWEDLVAPDISSSGQDVINEQIGGEYDIFLGVMWARFGSPTAEAESGTEEEFDRAVARHIAGEPIKVSFLFCTADVPQSNLDGHQYAKVQDFKKRAQGRGCLTRDFVDEASLINAINLILDRFANSWVVLDGSVDGLIGITSGGNVESASPIVVPASDLITLDEEDGLFDILEDFTRDNGNFILLMGEWAENLTDIGEKMNQFTDNISQISALGKPDPLQVRAIMAPLIDGMENFASWGEGKIVDLEITIDSVSNDAIKLLDISREMQEPPSDIKDARDTLVELVNSIDGANDGISSFSSALESSPRLDKRMSKAIRKIVSVHKRLVEKNRLFKENMLLCIDDLSGRI